ncbi:tetratricopeptide repeat protein [Telluribacter sp. SYSU D00476]|uniref:tetratricopeptide repeat protein n=1 Tax=Telluribacter sp. SYSU D00476 TaxID=2811430 RepID=UPI001FF4DBA3|nr:tetratricopeptide repeat protein [Telluribacter sp. SYSU D00476]
MALKYLYLNLGKLYLEESNYYNSIIASQYSFTRETKGAPSLNNIGLALFELGLHREALFKFNESVKYLEGLGHTSVEKKHYIYLNRAKVMRLLGDEENMQENIKKALHYGNNYSNTWIELSKWHISKCEFDSGLEAMDKAIKGGSRKPYVWTERGSLFQLLNFPDKAIKDFEMANKVSGRKHQTLYNLGRLYFLYGLVEKSQQMLISHKERNGWEEPYIESIYTIAIVQFVDREKGFGFLFGKTWFCDHDNIYFRVSDCKTLPNKGDRVKCLIKYKPFKGKLTASAYEIEPHNVLHNSRFKSQKIYHAIVHSRGNAINTVKDHKFVEVFFPFSAILPYNSISGQLDERLNLSFDKGYAFVEITMEINEYGAPIISYIKEASYPNSFSKKLIKSRHGDYLSTFPTRRCYICGGSEWCGTDGCPWDPS